VKFRTLTLLACAALCLSLAGCKAPVLAWSFVPTPDSVLGTTIEATADGGFLMGGGHDSTYNMYALKLSAQGAREWDKVFSNPTPDSNNTELWRQEASGARQTPDGGYVYLGAGHFFGDTLPEKSYLLVKTDAGGGIEWSKAYAPVNPYDADGDLCVGNRPAALQVTADGGYVAFGSSYVGGVSLASILKTDAAGNVEFHKVINDNAREYEQLIEAGQQTADGGYILAGHGADDEHGYMAMLIKLDAAGNLEWSETYQDTVGGHGAEAYAVVQTADGGYVMGGELINDIAKVLTHGCWIAKVDANGDALWFQDHGHGNTVHYPNALAETPQGDLLAAGEDASGKPLLAKFDAQGALVWNFTDERLPGANGKALALTADGGCAVTASGVSGGTVVFKVDNVFKVE
jgi:hypothetical protein